MQINKKKYTALRSAKQSLENKGNIKYNSNGIKLGKKESHIFSAINTEN